MIVYHGSYCIVNKPDIRYSREALDFGKGFYLTNIKEQAINWSKKFKIRGKKAYLNIYELELEKIKKAYKIKIFSNYDEEWLDFILECRNGSFIYKDYDILIGGIADDRVYNTMELYIDNLISKEETLKRLKYYKPNNQICIVNQEVIDFHLKFIKVKEV